MSDAVMEISSDPLFLDSDLDDYHLDSVSPAVDAGTDLGGTVDDDLDGNLRPEGTGWDMGCYEVPGGGGPGSGHYRILKWVEIYAPG